jgi:hypothetical protein
MDHEVSPQLQRALADRRQKRIVYNAGRSDILGYLRPSRDIGDAKKWVARCLQPNDSRLELVSQADGLGRALVDEYDLETDASTRSQEEAMTSTVTVVRCKQNVPVRE